MNKIKVYSIAALPTLPSRLSQKNARYPLVERIDCKQVGVVLLSNTHISYPVTPTPLFRLKATVLPNNICDGTVVFTSEFSCNTLYRIYDRSTVTIARTVASIRRNRATKKCLPLSGVDFATREPAIATTQHNSIYAMKRTQKLFCFSVFSTEHGDAKMKGVHLQTVKVLHPLCSVACQADA